MPLYLNTKIYKIVIMPPYTNNADSSQQLMNNDNSVHLVDYDKTSIAVAPNYYEAYDTTSPEPIWYSDPVGVILGNGSNRRYLEFIPTQRMTFAAQLNAVVRFALYFCLIVFAAKRSVGVFFILFAVLAITATMYHFDTNTNANASSSISSSISSISNPQRRRSSADCSRSPSRDNPFMNPVYGAGAEAMRANAQQACDAMKPSVKANIAAKYGSSLVTSVDDLWQTAGSNRQFYTVPCTDVCSDQGRFASWLYSDVGSSRQRHANANANAGH